MKTLLAIDIQNDFIPGGSLPVPGGDEIVPIVNRIQHLFDLIVASQDWHPQNHVSFASNHENKVPFDEIEVFDQPQTLWPDHCVQDTQGADFHPDLITTGWETIFRKGTDSSIDSYSAFFDNGHKKSTGLTGYLKEKEAKSLYFTGLAADICVYFSIKDALEAGFDCYMIEDAAKPLIQSTYDEQKKELIALGVHYVTSDELIIQQV